MTKTVLIANRGIIVSRIIRTSQKSHMKSAVVYTEADSEQSYLRFADKAYYLGSNNNAYTDAELMIKVAIKYGVHAIHPGYGFLSENSNFIEMCESAGIIWLGPTADQVSQSGYKHKARILAQNAGMPSIPGTGSLSNLDEAMKETKTITFPIMSKSSAGGGGIGMHICSDENMLELAFDSLRHLSERNFGDGSMYLEKYIPNARHIEVQIFGDGNGKVIAIGERDCSTQRRNQKVIEESPAPGISEKTRQNSHQAAIALGESINYRSAGTVEFIYDSDTEVFYFLEVNTRLQVEHGVTEMVWKIDSVEWMIKLGFHELPSLTSLLASLSPKGHAIQARLYAEDPLHGFRPCAGLLSDVALCQTDLVKGIRVDSTVETGTIVSPHFDPMLAKFIKYEKTREEAINGLVEMLQRSILYGIVTNKEWLMALLKDVHFTQANVSTQWLTHFSWEPSFSCEIIKPGMLTTIQDFPGRQGYWNVGVPPSGPFDDWSFRLGNRSLGNKNSASGLEITISGPTIKFFEKKNIVITGAPVPIHIVNPINGFTRALETWKVELIEKGEILEVGSILVGHGMRSYLLVEGGFDCPTYLGSQSTFTSGNFGGHTGRQSRSGDRLELTRDKNRVPKYISPDTLRIIAAISNEWEVRVIYGPHGAPDFFQEDDIKVFFEHKWEVHYNSSRTGIRLIGPRPMWARTDGGEAGLHPSNIHDNAYAFGTVDFTGDMPIILGPDGPSLGGFVSPAVIARCDRWILGQLAPGNKSKFVPISIEAACKLEEERDKILCSISRSENTANIIKSDVHIVTELGSPIIRSLSAAENNGLSIVYRRAGDDFLLIEFGKMELNITLRFCVHAWMLWLEKFDVYGIIDLTPGIRSLQIHYNPFELSSENLFAYLLRAEAESKKLEELELDIREIHLPLSWDDEECQRAIDHYQKSVWPKAPWCPSNLEFIRRINGLSSTEDIKKIVFEANYLVMGLGDVYLGAPVATPLDPSHRSVTTKYNPARTWTAENSVGIGGAYLCIYGMEGPGGYQFVGRTLQMWNRYRKTDVFTKPWLLRFFDQLKFYEVGHDELMQIRKEFPLGKWKLATFSRKFKLADYLESLEQKGTDILEFRKKRTKAFHDEIKMWHQNNLFTFASNELDTVKDLSNDISLSDKTIDSPLAGNAWKILVNKNDNVTLNQTVVIIESMKMEFPVSADADGIVDKVLVNEGSIIASGQPLLVMRDL